MAQEWELAQSQQPGNPDRPEELKQAEQVTHDRTKAGREAEDPQNAAVEHPGMPESGIPGEGAINHPNAGRTAEQLENLERD